MEQQQQQQQQQEVPSLCTLPDNSLQDIARRLDGHDLLSLLATSRDLRNSAALKACLYQAVLRQMAALLAAFRAILPPVQAVQATLQQAESRALALAGRVPHRMWRKVRMQVQCLRDAIQRERPLVKAEARLGLKGAQRALVQALAAGRPAGQAGAVGQAAGQSVQQGEAARQQSQPAGQPGQQAVGQPAQQPVGQQPGQQPAEQPLGVIVAQARQVALEALQVTAAPSAMLPPPQAMQAAQLLLPVQLQLTPAELRTYNQSRRWRPAELSASDIQRQRQELLAVTTGRQELLAVTTGQWQELQAASHRRWWEQPAVVLQLRVQAVEDCAWKTIQLVQRLEEQAEMPAGQAQGWGWDYDSDFDHDQ